MINYDSPKEIRQLLSEEGIALKKKWGQNFLISKTARERILKRIEPCESDYIWEIGPGLGAMTGPVLETGARLCAFEIDRGMSRCLKRLHWGNPAFRIIEGDFVRTYKEALALFGAPDKIFGNLPYSSASKIIMELVDGKLPSTTYVFTVQKELAQRMASKPGVKSYSSFSVVCQYAFEIKIQEELSPHSFFPQPEVSSSVVSLSPGVNEISPLDEKLFKSLIRASFSSRRKTLVNNVLSSDIARGLPKEKLIAVLSGLGLASETRAEELDVRSFVLLSNALGSF